MTFLVSTPSSDAAHRPDGYTFAPGDVVPNALILGCSTVAGEIEGDAPALRVAFVDDDEAQFTAEGDPIPEAEPDLAEVLVYTAKVTQLVRITSEQFAQTNTATQLSESVARALTRRANTAFVAEPAPVAPAAAPSAGLVETAGIIDGGALVDSLDVLTDLVALLQDNLAVPSAILVDPLGWGELRKLKVGTSYNQTLLGAGTSDAEQRLLGLPVIVDPAVPDYTGLVVDQRAVVSAVGPIKVATSEHEYFSSDSVLLRATWRFGHVVVRPNRIGKFSIVEPGS
ncbi:MULTISPECIES: phage major capsid protein [Mycolicibacterium]|jgi:HK97 family phage major capsid protein|uniref:phage major capsid protein n=1 Tax=Mycolicibacterium TaxID=1866885 RepID=UPI00298CF3FD|nr:phage major capsid protein [Mycolicibacterium sp. D5.8-2]MDW5610007.1 phage major capsid protein [Mycolicibacterium sp. D5.8-2]